MKRSVHKKGLRAVRKLVVSIINYKTAEMTCACIRSVLADLGDIDGEVVVVDNASHDGSLERLTACIKDEGWGDRVRLIASPTNTGFSGGHNQGMGAAEAEFYLLLNSDAALRPGCLAALLDAADGSPHAGLIAPRLEHEDGVQQISAFLFPTPATELVRGARTGLITRLFPRIARGQAAQSLGDDLEWASFACIMARGDMQRQIGPMDEGYFLYFEDIDYCLTARRQGWRVAYAADAVAVHHRGGSAPVKTLSKGRKRLPPYFYASRTRFFYKAHGRMGLLAANLLWMLGEGVGAARRLFGQGDLRPHDNELTDIWINFWSPLGDRRAPEG